MYEVQGLGYRRISQKLNSWGILTERGNKWFSTSVYSVLKRRKERDDRINNQRRKESKAHIPKFESKYYSFD
jgi:hypothetical protein